MRERRVFVTHTCRSRRLVSILLTGLICGIALVTGAHAQERDELRRLRSEAGRLHGEGKHADAASVAEQYLALALQKHGEDHLEVSSALSAVGIIYMAQGRYTQAEPLFRRALAIAEKARGPDDHTMAALLNNLGDLYRAQGRYAEAEPLYRRCLAIREKTVGVDSPPVGQSLNKLAELYRAQGRYAEAEPLSRRSLTITEKELGPDHPTVGRSLDGLAELYRAQGRYAEAESLLRRSLAISENKRGPDHPSVAILLIKLAELYRAQGRSAEAESLLRRSLANSEKTLGPDHPNVAASLNTLAGLYRVQGRYAETEPLLRRSLAIREKAFGPDQMAVGQSLNILALLYRDQERYAEAEPLQKRSLRIAEKVLGQDHPTVAQALHNVARLELARGNWFEAAAYWQRSTRIIERRAERGLTSAAEGSSMGEAQRLGVLFSGLIKATHRLAAPSPTAAQVGEMFATAQWAQTSEAATSLAQMAVRSSKGSAELAGLVRERQDLLSEWQTKDKLLIAAKSNEPAERKAAAEEALAGRLADIDASLSEISRRLAQVFPDYTTLASAAPVSVRDVQASLGPQEALVLFLDTDTRFKPLPEESFVWVVTSKNVRWIRSELGTEALTREVAALRCGLDVAAWDGEGTEKCATALGIRTAKEAPNILPFDHARAYKLYQDLFGEVQDLIKGKHLLIVPSGPLAQLPFQVLVTKLPVSGDHHAVAWLARDHVVSVLPAVSSLKALRRVAGPSAAQRPMIGIGNPLLEGADASSQDRARLARGRQRCPETLGRWRVAVTGHRPGVRRIETRSGLANLAHLKEQPPLPETTDELCDVAHDVKADLARDIRLGSQATEREVKRLSEAGELAKYRMLHFATHGALAGQLDGTHEPGLILTPPATATEDDDGYLSASEIAALKLDADWVILSACNTAAGGASNAEALSGLGRAFIYAGARSLLVSHWAVDSDATVKLITGAVREIALDPKVGRGEAIRRSMLALIDKGTLEEAHPAFWAPFVVVGEGAAGR
jgi:CHAT domain-containing protein/Tfp pilus assembly protein PilF